MMKRTLLFFALLCVGSLIAQPSFAAQTLEVEPNHSTIGFSIPIAGGLTRVTGKFTDFEIFLTYDGDEVLADVGSWKLVAKIATSSIDTGIEARDRHLRQPDFFDAEAHPEIRFTSEHIEGPGPDYVAFGELKMHGVTRPLELPFTVTGFANNKATGAFTVGATAKTRLLKSAWGIAPNFQHTHIDNFLGDEIEIEIFCWLRPLQENAETAESEDAPPEEE